jgi:protein ImuB
MFISLYCPSGSSSLSDFAYAFSPLVEETAPDTVVIDVEGCELRFGSAYQLASEISTQSAKAKNAGGWGSKINVAIAANPDVAVHAARFYEGISFIAPGEELMGLASLPLECLRFHVSNSKSKHSQPSSVIKQPQSEMGNWTIDEKQFQEILETLHLWGINTFGELAALPLNGVSERLGQAGVKLQQLASGKNERHLKLVQPAPVFNNAVELEYPIVQLEPLSFIFARLLNQLCAALNAYALATNELRVILKLENQQSHERILNLPYPMRDNKVFLKLLLLDAEMHPPASAVIAISLSCEPVKPRLLQNGLFIPLAPEPEKLELTLARLNKLLGPGNVGSPELLDTHRPDAFRVGRFTLRDPPSHKHRHKSELQRLNDPRECALGFRMFRPPLRAMVETGRGCPKQISAWGKQLSVYGKIVRLAGPWRTTGDWWRSDNWAREEWDVAVETSCLGPRTNNKAPTAEALYRIYRELPNGAWFVEGSYD